MTNPAQEFPVILCMVCERRGPKAISFRIETLETGGYKMMAECVCGNKELCFERMLPEEINKMAESGGFDFSTTKRFKKL